jgi:hypothetical protein
MCDAACGLLFDAVPTTLQACGLRSHIIRSLRSQLGSGPFSSGLRGIKAALRRRPVAAFRLICGLLRLSLAVLEIGD